MAGVFLDEIGGKETIARVHTIFYGKLLSHPWMKQFFVGLQRWHLEEQQTDFMTDMFGGKPKCYQGRLPMKAHQHLFITDEVFMMRHKLLADSLAEAKIPEDQRLRWLEFDLSMKAALVKETIDDCEKRFNTDDIIAVPRPDGF